MTVPFGTLAQALEDLQAEARQAVLINTYIASHVLQLIDAGAIVEMNSASSTVVTVPALASIPFPVRTRIDLVGIGAGTVTVAAAGGVTIRSKSGALALSAQYAAASLYVRGTDEWVLAGDLA